MVRLWTLEAMAHGAELVSYFRWRQAPFGQEQLHAGLLRPDNKPAPALAEVAQAGREIDRLRSTGTAPKSVALIFSYEADWVTTIQPQGAGLSALWATFDCYSALRKLGLDIDILPPGAVLDGYALCVIPCLPIESDELCKSLDAFSGQVVIGPRSGSRTGEFSIPDGLPPGDLFPAKVARVESLRAGLQHNANEFSIELWLEHLETDAEAEFVTRDGTVAGWRNGNRRYLAAWPTIDFASLVLTQAAKDAGLASCILPDGIRMRRLGSYTFIFNYSAQAINLPEDLGGMLVLGDRRLEPAGVAVLTEAL
jgi:beta-galactosidase